jgi:NAD/NADP transhydrogenase beta subunit
VPGKNLITAGLALGCVPAYVAYAGTADPTLALEMLGGATLASLALGFLSAASVGGADMPVIITLLNSYSGCESEKRFQ